VRFEPSPCSTSCQKTPKTAFQSGLLPASRAAEASASYRPGFPEPAFAVNGMCSRLAGGDVGFRASSTIAVGYQVPAGFGETGSERGVLNRRPIRSLPRCLPRMAVPLTRTELPRGIGNRF